VHGPDLPADVVLEVHLAADVCPGRLPFWLIITNVARKIASRLTIMVRRPKGNLSKASEALTRPRLTATQTPNQTVCT
jgi:hypothetical protein